LSDDFGIVRKGRAQEGPETPKGHKLILIMKIWQSYQVLPYSL